MTYDVAVHFRMSKQMLEHINLASHQAHMGNSEYLRKLILKDMKKKAKNGRSKAK